MSTAVSRARLRIRDAGNADRDRLVEFNRAMARETEDLELCAETVRDGVGAVLADAGRGFYLVAEHGDEVAGTVLVTFEWSDWRNGDFWWIQSVYVRPEHRGRGVYRALYREVRDRARERGGVCGFRLYVERANRSAQAVYRRLGMRESGYVLFEEALARGNADDHDD